MVAVVAGLALAVSACTRSGADRLGEPADDSEIRSGKVTIEGSGPIDAAYASGNRIYGLSNGDEPLELAVGMDTILFGTLSPAAVPVGERGALLYNAWPGDRPVIRLHDRTRATDRVIADGAYSIAWRSDGVLAYVKGVTPKVDLEDIKDYAGHVVVQRGSRAPAARWTSKPARYVVAAWARQRLLAYRIDRKWPDLMVFAGSRGGRVLARSSALIALSPDGRRAFVAGYGAEPPVVRVVDVSEGKELARLPLTKDAVGTRVEWIVEAGSWVDDLVVAKTSAGLVVFKVALEEITVEQYMRIDASAFPLGVFEPRIVGDGRSIVAWGQLEGQPREAVPPAVVLQCDRVELRCVRGPEVSAAEGPRMVYNPSRP